MNKQGSRWACRMSLVRGFALRVAPRVAFVFAAAAAFGQAAPIAAGAPSASAGSALAPSTALASASAPTAAPARAAPAALSGARSGVDLDDYYRFIASGAVYYQRFSAIGNGRLSDFNIDEISGEARVPIPTLPSLQALVRGGLVSLAYLEDDNQDWSHSQVFGGAGVAYVRRLSREVELGGELYLGLAESYFNSLVVDGQTIAFGQANFMAGLGARIALNPSYNLSISVSPSIRFTAALGQLSDFDGFSFATGFSASYRIGQDPDAAQSAVKAIRFGAVKLPPLFAAMRSYYASKPAGSFSINNGERYGISDVSVSFMQPGFMDSPTPLASGLALGPGESADIQLLATFNDQVFSTEGMTPLTGEIIVEYSAKGRRVEQRQSVSYELYDRNAMTWDDDRKVAAFITPQDGAIRNYASFIRQAHKAATSAYVPANLQFAMQAFNALSELGIIYQVDPVAPFASMKGDAAAVDSVSLPRQTIKRRTGDCDDLTALFCTLLESVGVETALVTVPGHIYCAFDSGVGASEFRLLASNRAMAIESNGKLWVPIEITLIGTSTFAEAWRIGVQEWADASGDPGSRGFYKVKDAQALYRPVSLRETDLGLQYGEEAQIVARFRKDLETQIAGALRPLREAAAANPASAQAWNGLGVASAQLGEFAEARKAFERAIGADAAFLNARVNLGSLLALQGDNADALVVLRKAEAMASAPDARVSDSTRFKILVNLGKAAHATGGYAEAKACYEKASAIDAQAAKEYEFLASGQAGK